MTGMNIDRTINIINAYLAEADEATSIRDSYMYAGRAYEQFNILTEYINYVQPATPEQKERLINLMELSVEKDILSYDEYNEMFEIVMDYE